VAARSATPGMVLGRPVYDFRGQQVLREGEALTAPAIAELMSIGAGDLLIHDARVADVLVGSLFPPSLEAQGVHAMFRLLERIQATPRRLIAGDLYGVAPVVKALVACAYPVILGDPDLSGTSSVEGYDFAHPVKVAMLAVYLGTLLDQDDDQLITLATSGILANVGQALLPPGLLASPGEPDDNAWRRIEAHPVLGAELLRDSGISSDVLAAIAQHHERWDGGGYPAGLRGDEIALAAQVVSIADMYHALLSARPYREPLPFDEAVQTVMAASGTAFSPALVQTFVHGVPQYPAGLGVELSTGQVGIVSNPNPGQIGRPVVRICMEQGRPVPRPYDLDLSRREQLATLVVDVQL
jgi:HD-GYP domain-containing protein (c-di-GMP phosphodiesterase class II)